MNTESEIRELIVTKKNNSIALTEEEVNVALQYMPLEEIQGLYRPNFNHRGCFMNADLLSQTPKTVKLPL